MKRMMEKRIGVGFGQSLGVVDFELGCGKKVDRNWGLYILPLSFTFRYLTPSIHACNWKQQFVFRWSICYVDLSATVAN